MSSSTDTAGAKAVVAAANQKGRQLTTAETASVLSGVNRSSGGGSYTAPVTDMSQWYRDTQAAQGSKPTAEQVSAAMDSYRGYVAGKTNPNSGVIWNQYGEKVGNTGTGSGGYTDFSDSARNAIVNPNHVVNDINNPGYAQRYLTSTEPGSPGFLDYSQLGQLADNYIKNNPNTTLSRDDLMEMWMGKYGDINNIPNLMSQYSNEFAYGRVPVIGSNAPTVDGANNIAAQGTQTIITLPDGSQVVGYIVNGRTALADGSKPPVGSYINTADGIYQMTDNGGVKVDGIPNTFSNKTNMPGEFVSGNYQDSEYMTRMEGLLKQNEEAYVQQQLAMLTKNRDREIAELEKVYEEQVAEGKISVREAEMQFNEQKKLIEEQYYLNSQKTSLYLQEMGIQNSQQAVGLMQGDDARKGELTQAAQSDYQKRIANVRDRVNVILRQKDLDIARANSDFDTGVLGAYGAAKLNTGNQLFDLYQSERQNAIARQEAEITRQHQFEMAMYQHQLQLEQMVKAGEISMEQAAVEFERQKQLLQIKFGYDVSLAGMRGSGSGSGSTVDTYMQILLRKADKLGIDPNKLPKGVKSLAQAVDEAEWQQTQDRNREEYINNLITKADVEDATATYKAGKPVAPKKPADDFWMISPLGYYIQNQKYKKAKPEYDKQLDAYNRALKLLGKDK